MALGLAPMLECRSVFLDFVYAVAEPCPNTSAQTNPSSLAFVDEARSVQEQFVLYWSVRYRTTLL